MITLIDVKKFYCKYIIDIIYKRILILRKNNILDNCLDKKLYESYLKLEEFLKED